MADHKFFELVEGLNLNITCRIKRRFMQPIIWMKDGILLGKNSSIYFNMIDTMQSSILTLKNLQTHHTGNYTCRGDLPSRQISKWIYLKVNSRIDDSPLKAGRAVADEPDTNNQQCQWNEYMQSFNCGPNINDLSPEKNAGHQELSNDGAIGVSHVHIPSNSPTGDKDSINNSVYTSSVRSELPCDSSVEVCDEIFGAPFSIIGISTLCTLLLVVVLVSALVIRRKLLRERNFARARYRNQRMSNPMNATSFANNSEPNERIRYQQSRRNCDFQRRQYRPHSVLLAELIAPNSAEILSRKSPNLLRIDSFPTQQDVLLIDPTPSDSSRVAELYSHSKLQPISIAESVNLTSKQVVL